MFTKIKPYCFRFSWVLSFGVFLSHAHILETMASSIITPRYITSGISSGKMNKEFVTITDQDEWFSFWQRNISIATISQEVPVVDFKNEIIVGVFLGQKNSAGYMVSIEAVHQMSDRVIVMYREIAPQKGMVSASIITYPYCLATIPVTHLPIEFKSIEMEGSNESVL